MFYFKTGKMKQRLKKGSRPVIIELQSQPGRSLRVTMPNILSAADRFQILCGRGNDLGWAAIWFYQSKGKDYKLKRGSHRTRLYLNSHMGLVADTYTLKEKEFHIDRDVLYVHIPHGFAKEKKGWYSTVPDVSDNPWQKLDELRDMQRMQHGFGEGSGLEQDERPMEG